MPVASGYHHPQDKTEQRQQATSRPIPAAQASWYNDTGDNVLPGNTASGNDDYNYGRMLDAQYGSFEPEETRRDLIQRIKRQQRPQHLLSLEDDRYPGLGVGREQHFDTTGGREQHMMFDASDEGTKFDTNDIQTELASSIERPRSALHRGDFRGGEPDKTTSFGTEPATPRDNFWLATSPPASSWLHRQPLSVSSTDPVSTPVVSPRHAPLATPVSRARAISHTLRSSFVFRAPTSPLANQSNSSDLDAFETYKRVSSKSPDRANRRHTFSPPASQRFFTSPSDLALPHNSTYSAFTSQRPISLPYQAHQPRRSLASLDEKFSHNSIWARSAHSRRPSLSSETSPLHRAPMIGRYEESILRGRMSSLPSQPLDFVAQIGVLGKGNCKSSLRCPAHVTVPFPAIFYHYGSPGVSTPIDGPSPYVGLVDLEKNNKGTEKAKKNRRRRSPEKPAGTQTRYDDMDIDFEPSTVTGPRKSRADGRSQDGPKGAYRIPEQGQLQVIIRNPNKTAVKLFLVPYDLAGMKPGQKTFIRQRSYSAGPILVMPLDSKKEAVSDKGVPVHSPVKDATERPVLRYLIHLHICCSSRGRFYLYKSIRVVFANRVPDGKEKLRQEIQLPDPRFSAYKPDVSSDVKVEARHAKTDSDRADFFRPTLGSSARTRRNFAWESYAQEEQAMVAVGSLPMNLCFFPEADESSTAHGAASDQLGNASVGASVSSLASLELNNSPPTFERLGKEDWSYSGAPPRTQSPQPGQGLISQQYRDWTSRTASPE